MNEKYIQGLLRLITTTKKLSKNSLKVVLTLKTQFENIVL
jgi:uncharacterized protein YaaN involved in tellurite resistance